jgi:hypothetical protein
MRATNNSEASNAVVYEAGSRSAPVQGERYEDASAPSMTQAKRVARYPKWFQARVRSETEARQRKTEE